jgi:type II secretory pathway component PulK
MFSSRAIKRRRSSGYILAFVLICLTIVVLALVAMTQRLALAHRQVIQRERQLQAQWLVEAGIGRATAKLRRDAQYSGEVWQLSADELRDRSARVEIEVQPSDRADLHQIRIVAIYPDQIRLAIREEGVVVVRNSGEAKSP